MITSTQTKAEIYSAWLNSVPPSVVASKLRLALVSVIAEYVKLAEESRITTTV